MEWVAIPLSSRSLQPRDRAWVSCVADRFFSVRATREAHSCVEYDLSKLNFYSDIGEDPCSFVFCFFFFWLNMKEIDGL